jgi:hypothetical protein
MFINWDNFQVGNKAVAAILLLYYHLLQEGGFTNDETVYLREMEFDGFAFMNTRMLKNCESHIDVLLINEGAAIYLLCELNDQIINYEDDFLSQPYTQKIISFYQSNSQYFFFEFAEVMQLVLSGESRFNYAVYKVQLAKIYKKYVVEKLQTLCNESYS